MAMDPYDYGPLDALPTDLYLQVGCLMLFASKQSFQVLWFHLQFT